MQKLMCAAVCFLSVGLLAYGETLTYQGGGIWDSSSLTWKDESGETVAWKNGSVAAFPEGVQVEVAEGITAGGLVAGTDAAPDATLTFSGSPLTFAADAVITTSLGSLVFQNDVKGEGNLTVERAAGVVVSDELAEGMGFPFGAANAVTVFRNRKLSDVKAVSGALTTYWYTNENADYLYPGNGEDRGVYCVENNGSRLTALFQGYHGKTDSYGNAENDTVKLVLEQVGSDISGYVESCYRLAKLGVFGVSVPEEPIVTGNLCAKYYTDLSKLKSEKGHCRVSLVGVDLALVAPEVIFAANVNLTTNDDTLRAGCGMTVRLSGSLGDEKGYLGRFCVDSGASVICEPSDPVTIATPVGGDTTGLGIFRVEKGAVVNFTNSDGAGSHNAWLLVGGTVLDKSTGYGLSKYISVRDGGVLVSEIHNTTYNRGLSNALQPRVFAGGEWRANLPYSLSNWQTTYTILGGRLNVSYQFANDSEQVGIVKLSLVDGAQVVGGRLSPTGLFQYKMSGTIYCSGTRASRIDCDGLWLYHNANLSGKSGFIELNVADVTADDRADLIISTSVLDKVAIPPSDYTQYGLHKQSSGTVEFGDTVKLNGILKLEAGTARFVRAESAIAGFRLTGDAALDVTDGAQVAFGDSSSVAWTEGKTLTLKSRLDRKSLRFGTNANGLTTDQLAAIRYADSVTTKTPVFMLDAKGYLTDGLGGGFFIRVR